MISILYEALCTHSLLKVTNMTKKETALEGGKLLIEVVKPAKKYTKIIYESATH